MQPPIVILSLVGDQTIPNVQFIKALPTAGEYWFIETEKTNNAMRTDSIMEACGIQENRTKICLVKPEALEFVPPDDWKIRRDITYYVNLTGGTKMMALSVYRCYVNVSNIIFHYSPIGASKSLPLDPSNKPFQLPELGLRTYLLAQGYLALDPFPLSAPFKRSKNLFERVVKANKPGDIPEINRAAEHQYNAQDKSYLLGTWFEDYLYYAIQSEFNLHEHQIIRGLRLQHIISKAMAESDQEIDVAFLYRGTLYLVECKVYPHKAGIQKLSDPVYKLGAINRTFGLGAKAIVCILGPEGLSVETRQRLEYLRTITNVHAVVTVENLRNNASLKSILNIK